MHRARCQCRVVRSEGAAGCLRRAGVRRRRAAAVSRVRPRPAHAARCIHLLSMHRVSYTRAITPFQLLSTPHQPRNCNTDLMSTSQKPRRPHWTRHRSLGSSHSLIDGNYSFVYVPLPSPAYLQARKLCMSRLRILQCTRFDARHVCLFTCVFSFY